MNKSEIWEVLQACLLASEGVDIEYLKEKGFNPGLSKIGVQLYQYLKSKQISLEVIE